MITNIASTHEWSLTGSDRRTRFASRFCPRRLSPVVQVVQLESPLERLSDCRTVPYLRFFLVRNEEAGGSNPLSSTRFSSSVRNSSAATRSDLTLRGTQPDIRGNPGRNTPTESKSLDSSTLADFPLLIAVSRYPDHFAIKLLRSAVNSSAPGGSFPSVIRPTLRAKPSSE